MDSLVRYQAYLDKLEEFIDRVIEDDEDKLGLDFVDEAYQLREEGFRVHNDLEDIEYEQED